VLFFWVLGGPGRPNVPPSFAGGSFPAPPFVKGFYFFGGCVLRSVSGGCVGLQLKPPPICVGWVFWGPHKLFFFFFVFLPFLVVAPPWVKAELHVFPLRGGVFYGFPPPQTRGGFFPFLCPFFFCWFFPGKKQFQPKGVLWGGWGFEGLIPGTVFSPKKTKTLCLFLSPGCGVFGGGVGGWCGAIFICRSTGFLLGGCCFNWGGCYRLF